MKGKDIRAELERRVLVLDGAMGTMIQRHNLTVDDFRGKIDVPEHFKLKGCNDLLCLTRPDVIRGIHRSYIDAGADIIETDSFNANAISLADYGLADKVKEINIAAARIAREEADAAEEREERPVFVAGSIGPSNVALSIAGASDDVTFDSMSETFREQCSALIEGGVDLILLETIFDTLNAKAAILGVRRAIADSGKDIPLMLSVTLTQQGRTISGQTLEAWLDAVRHAEAISVGINCVYGDLIPEWLDKLQGEDCFVSLHVNAGLPDELGQYNETPEKMARAMSHCLNKGMLNIVGGCCGTTPEHIRAIAEVTKNVVPRKVPRNESDVLRLAGLDTCHISPRSGFVKVGERCNVAGSRKFLRLVNEGNLPEALEVATAQISKGAQVLDINMDDGMLNAPSEMECFVTLLGADAITSKLPLMIDSSNMDVIRRALRRIQGRPIVNSISLKEGEETFLSHAREIRALGGAVVVMAFDEEGQATTLERRISICRRAYQLLTEKAGFKGEDIVFDPNILTIATGVSEHDRYALDFLDAVSWIKQNLKGAKVSGGVSNLSFSFRGHDKLREAMHTVFLHYAIERGMDMAIVNPSTSTDISTVDASLREAIEDVLFCRRVDATDRLLEIASEMKAEADRRKALRAGAISPVKPKGSGEATIESLVEKGIDSGLIPLLDKAMEQTGSAMAVVKERLMAAMERVGDEFGAGRMFLPQVVRSATVMKRAIDYLTPSIERESASTEGGKSRGTFVIATVKGDVHDIGKNIVGVILRCSGYDVIDLGVMVEGTKIVETIKATGAKLLGLSGLITPSLSEMCAVAELLEKEGLTDVTLFVGGATTTDLHTAVKIAPLFSGLTIHTRDAAQLPPVAASVEDDSIRNDVAYKMKNHQEELRREFVERQNKRASIERDTEDIPAKASLPSPVPSCPGISDLRVHVSDIVDLINWRAFLHAWEMSPSLLADSGKDQAHPHHCDCCNLPTMKEEATVEARRLISDAKAMINELIEKKVYLDARVAMVPAYRDGDDMVIRQEKEEVVIPTLRRESAPYLSVADFVTSKGSDRDDWIGLFVVTTRNVFKALPPKGDDYHDLLVQSLADRLVEAATDYVHTHEHQVLHGLSTDRRIRPAIGYPSLPDQTLVFETDKILHYADLGISLTENGALSPSSTTTGFIFSAPESRYFEVGEISDEQLADYARRRHLPVERLRNLLPRTT